MSSIKALKFNNLTNLAATAQAPTSIAHIYNVSHTHTHIQAVKKCNTINFECFINS